MYGACGLCHQRAYVQRMVVYGSSMTICAACAQHAASMRAMRWSPTELARLHFMRHLYQTGRLSG